MDVDIPTIPISHTISREPQRDKGRETAEGL